MPDDEETCGQFDCQTCYPGGVREMKGSDGEKVVAFAKTYEM